MHARVCVCSVRVCVSVRILFTQKSRLKAQRDTHTQTHTRKRWKQINKSLNKRAMIEKLTSHASRVCVCVSEYALTESTEMN